MQYNQPQIKEPIRPEQLEALGLHFIEEKYGKVLLFWNQPLSFNFSSPLAKFELYSNGYISCEVLTNNGNVPTKFASDFTDINHFTGVCASLGITFNQ